MTKINIKTKDMHCPSCEMLVKDSLEELEGVNSVSASFEKNIILVDFDDKKVSVDKIKKVIKDEGYETK